MEEILLQQCVYDENAEMHPLFKAKLEECYFTTLIKQHVLKDEKIREFKDFLASTLFSLIACSI